MVREREIQKINYRERDFLLLPSGNHDLFVDGDRHSRIICPRQTTGSFAAVRHWEQRSRVGFYSCIFDRMRSLLLFLRQLFNLFDKSEISYIDRIDQKKRRILIRLE